jgi:predicted MPP superfamily phosphohydrolase
MRIWRIELGAFGPVQVRHEEVPLGMTRPVRMMYASDLHLGHWWTREVGMELIRLAARLDPEVVLLGGDLIDHARALPALAICLRALSDMAVVGAVPGNHDERAGCSEVKDAVLASGGHWLPQTSLTVGARVDGIVRTADSNRPRVLCTHDPKLFPFAVAAGYRLVLAGHLHGGQCVLAICQERLYPAAWLNRWHGLCFRSSGSTMLVSRGLADIFPVRFNCPREVLLCDLC